MLVEVGAMWQRPGWTFGIIRCSHGWQLGRTSRRFWSWRGSLDDVESRWRWNCWKRVETWLDAIWDSSISIRSRFIYGSRFIHFTQSLIQTLGLSNHQTVQDRRGLGEAFCLFLSATKCVVHCARVTRPKGSKRFRRCFCTVLCHYVPLALFALVILLCLSTSLLQWGQIFPDCWDQNMD